MLRAAAELCVGRLEAMPYELTFSKTVAAPENADYINECCYGGDVVGRELLPHIKQRFGEVQFGQEDWGWFLWFSEGRIGLAVDIFCDDQKAGNFRAMLTSHEKRFLLPDRAVDTKELEELRALVVPILEQWSGASCSVEKA